MDNEHFCLSSRFTSHLRVTQESEILCGSLSAACACRQVGHLVEVFSGEIGRIELVLEVGYKWRIDVTDGAPVDSVEEGMTLDLVNIQSVLCTSEEPGGEES